MKLYSTEQGSKFLKNKQKWITCGAAVMVLIPLIMNGFVEFAYWCALHDLREKGYPTNLEELDAYYAPVPNEENAALDYEQAFDSYKDAQRVGLDPDDLLDSGEKVRLIVRIHIPEGRLESSREFVAANIESLNAMEKGSQKTKYRYSTDFSESSRAFRLKTGSRACCRLAAMKAVIAAYDGRRDECSKWLKIAIASSGTQHNEPLELSQLVDIACFRISTDALEYSVGTMPFSDEQLKELSAAVDAAYNKNWLRTAAVGERAILLCEWSRARKMSFFQRLRPVQNLNKLKYLDLTEWLTEFPDDIGLLEARSAETLDSVGQLGSLYDPCRTLPLKGWLKRYKEHSARKNLIQTMIAAERFRVRHGALPTKLDDLVPEYLETVPVDPFTQGLLLLSTKEFEVGLDADFAVENPQSKMLDKNGENMRKWAYHNRVSSNTIVASRLMKVWRVYSVGEDLQDNGGSPGFGRRGTDIVMLLPLDR